MLPSWGSSCKGWEFGGGLEGIFELESSVCFDFGFLAPKFPEEEGIVVGGDLFCSDWLLPWFEEAMKSEALPVKVR